MISTERRHEILQIASVDGRVNVLDLAHRFGVSEVTIRKDLELLDRRGALQRTRGGATASKGIFRELSLLEKIHQNADLKKKLAWKAREYIRDGDAIIIDSGSTTGEISCCLNGFNNLKVMTNSLNVAQAACQYQGVEIMMSGGNLRKKSQSLFGKRAEEGLMNYNFDKVFLGVDGYEFTAGVTTHFEQEAILNRKMCEVSQYIIAVTDSSKFGRSSLHKICNFGSIDILVTDSNIPPKYADALLKSGVELSIVEAT